MLDPRFAAKAMMIVYRGSPRNRQKCRMMHRSTNGALKVSGRSRNNNPLEAAAEKDPIGKSATTSVSIPKATWTELQVCISPLVAYADEMFEHPNGGSLRWEIVSPSSKICSSPTSPTHA